MQLLITCSNCGKMSNIEKGALHIDFLTGEIYCICPECHKDNKMKFDPKPSKYPKTRRLI